MKAKYLTVEDKPINVGDKYYRVNKYPPFDMYGETADGENNVTNACYFLSFKDAEYYQMTLQMNVVIQKHLKIIEERHCGKLTTQLSKRVGV